MQKNVFGDDSTKAKTIKKALGPTAEFNSKQAHLVEDMDQMIMFNRLDEVGGTNKGLYEKCFKLKEYATGKKKL